MNRREAIEKTAWLLGSAVSASAIAGVLNGCKPSPTLNYKPVFLDESQALTIGEVAEIILPRTDTPGAKDVSVPSFIDIMLKEVYSSDEQKHFLEGLETFEKEAKDSFNKKFIDCEPSVQIGLVKKNLEAASIQSGQTPFIQTVKELTLLGFFTSEVGATQVLQYNPAPGPYQGCVPLTQVGKAWAT
jgi:hypothetical protein